MLGKSGVPLLGGPSEPRYLGLIASVKFTHQVKIQDKLGGLTYFQQPEKLDRKPHGGN